MLVLQTTATTTKRYRGMLDCGASLIKRQGIRSLWNGTTSRILHSILARPLSDLFYQYYVQIISMTSPPPPATTISDDDDDDDDDSKKKKKTTKPQKLSQRQMALGYYVAGILSMMVVYPLEVAAVHLSSDRKNHFQTIRECWNAIGIAGMYRGMGFTILGALQHQILYNWCCQVFSSSSSSPSSLFTSPLVSVMAELPRYPLLVIQRNLIISNQTLSQIVQGKGWRLAVGVEAYIAKVILSGFVTAVYGKVGARR